MGRLNETTEVKLQAHRECPANGEQYRHCLRFSLIHKVFSFPCHSLYLFNSFTLPILTKHLSVHV